MTGGHNTVWLGGYNTVWLGGYNTVWLGDYNTVWLGDYNTVWLGGYNTVWLGGVTTSIHTHTYSLRKMFPAGRRVGVSLTAKTQHKRNNQQFNNASLA